jgi:hypothetical protein
VADSTWLILREQGAIVEEADEDGEENEGRLGTKDKFDEKGALAEKVGLHLQNISARVDMTNVEDNDDGRKEIRLGESETDPAVLR